MADASAWLRLPEAELYKADARSRVWRVVDAASGGQYVIKRFEYSPLRQRLGWWLGVHPAQRERRNAEKWSARGVPIVPIVAGGFDGGKAWLATELRGVSLERMIGELRGDATRLREVSRSVGKLVASLRTAGACFRDLKTSNIVIDADSAARLIDVGSMRKARSHRDTHRMLGMLDHTARRDGYPASARLRCLKLSFPLLLCAVDGPNSTVWSRRERPRALAEKIIAARETFVRRAERERQ